MKKIFMFLAFIGILAVSAEFQQANSKAAAPVVPDTEQVNPFDAPQESQPMHQAIKKIFIEGGATFMSLILVCLVFGLAIVIERILTLSLAQQNSKKLAAKVEEKLKAGDIDGALDICRDTRGPVASIYYQGLLRVKEGQDIENIEKSVVSYGSVQMGQLESGMSWIALFIGIAPMLGFMGTVLGLIQAFDAIEVAGDISPALVAGGMKVALITTVGGLVVAIILQIFYNYLVSKIDGVVVDMENASIDLVDLLVKYRK